MIWRALRDLRGPPPNRAVGVTIPVTHSCKGATACNSLPTEVKRSLISIYHVCEFELESEGGAYRVGNGGAFRYWHVSRVGL